MCIDKFFCRIVGEGGLPYFVARIDVAALGMRERMGPHIRAYIIIVLDIVGLLDV